ncbi:ganglioside GM2 activator-like isoform X1 [Ruditapes philippinarum]|uniref:ganglioside GM2 activator-like isoform X1 n=1 Tax=Ruditapes philippinarum TaxID=129788 RepID=UPI00295C0843|nr:ganglioside GM2 activator-like isoform X1 [Ruditapes philippinarum]
MKSFYLTILWTFVAIVIFAKEIQCRRGRKKRDKYGLKFSDCGADPDRPLRFYDVKAHPIPIITPGTLYVSFKGNISRDLPRTIAIELGLVKYFVGIPFPLPCFDNRLGSCSYYNICDNLQKYELLGCPKTIKQYGVQCSCPFKAGEFNVRNLPLNIPKVRGFARAFIRVRGDYGLTLRILDDDSTELGCLRLGFSVKKRYKGWLFKI